MRKSLFLFLAIACFLGVIAIFIVDGYMGVYDTLAVTTGEQTITIQSDAWQNMYPAYAPVPASSIPVGRGVGSYNISANLGDNISFDYVVENRLFSTYQADIEVTVEHSQQKVMDLLSPAVQPLSISAFGTGKLDWVVDNNVIVPKDLPAGQSYQYTIIVKRGDVQRAVLVYVNPLPLINPIPIQPPTKF